MKRFKSILRYAVAYVAAHILILPILIPYLLAMGAEKLSQGLALLVDDRPWTIWLFAKADQLEEWAKRP